MGVMSLGLELGFDKMEHCGLAYGASNGNDSRVPTTERKVGKKAKIASY